MERKPEQGVFDMNRTDRKSNGETRQIRCILRGGLMALLGSTLLLFLSSVLILRGCFSLSFAPKLALASCALSGFFSALFTVKRVAGKAMTISFSVGLIQCLSLLLLGLFLLEDLAPGLDQFPMAATCLCSAGLAGLLRKRGKKKRRS